MGESLERAEIASFLLQKESQYLDVTSDSRSERAFRSEIEETLAHARGKNEHFVGKENKQN